MMAVFLGCIMVQFNDSDLALWVFVYTVPLVACVMWEWGVLGVRWPAFIAVLGLFGATCLSFLAPFPVGLSMVVSQWEMVGDDTETLRESGGLLVVASWMAVLAWVEKRKFKGCIGG